jgi:hypothetical protein
MDMSKVKLVETCGACPEQYDAYINGDKIGYLRLRHGYFYTEYLPTGEKVYEAHPDGDGIFWTEERTKYLNAASQALLEAYEKTPEPIFEIVDERDI